MCTVQKILLHVISTFFLRAFWELMSIFQLKFSCAVVMAGKGISSPLYFNNGVSLHYCLIWDEEIIININNYNMFVSYYRWKKVANSIQQTT